MYRGFENMLIGRSPLDSLVITPRICGICTTSHLKAAAKALDMAYKANTPDDSLRLRNVTVMTEMLQNDIRQSFLLFFPDFTSPAHAQQPLYDEALRRYAVFKGEAVVQTIRETKKLLEIISILGGQWPHSSFIVPGGVVSLPSSNDIGSCRHLLSNFRRWYETNVLGCTLERWGEIESRQGLEEWLHEKPAHSEGDVGFFIRFAKAAGLDTMGMGPGTFISFGGLTMPTVTRVAAPEGHRNYMPSGFYDGEAVQVFDERMVREDVSRAYFDDYMGPSHPFNGRTLPLQPTGDGKKYSWSKAPRYHGKPAETGPLAERIIASDPLFLDLPAGRRGSVFERQLARLVRPAALIPIMDQWLKEMLRQDSEFFHNYHTKKDGDGVGLIQAPRGALGHWMKIVDNKIANYQIITPTAWNLSPTDKNDLKGPCEHALVGTRVADPDNPVEVEHVIRSFDPCLVCCVHAVTPDGNWRNKGQHNNRRRFTLRF